MLWIVPIGLLFIGVFLCWQNNGIVVSRIKHQSSKIPEAFNGYRIILVSDLHNKSFGKDQNRLVKKIQENNPDIIVITGDLIDQRRYNLKPAMDLINKAVAITDTFYVSGNHEFWSGKYEEIRSALEKVGVRVLDDLKSQIVREGAVIEILGLSDPAFHISYYEAPERYEEIKSRLNKLTDERVFQILLSHRPEFFELYVDQKVDLTLAGHTHGGQFRIPKVGGLMAAGQGFFPKYIDRLYEKEDTTMVVSRGLGNSIIPIRIGNPPELVVVTLKISKEKHEEGSIQGKVS